MLFMMAAEGGFDMARAATPGTQIDRGQTDCKHDAACHRWPRHIPAPGWMDRDTTAEAARVNTAGQP